MPKFYDQMKRFGKSIGTRGRHEYRWVLKDVTLEVQPGGTLALIGINGSGKTTLLKIISQVTYQSAGRCDVRGPDRGAAERDQRHPPGPHRPGERLPLRRGAGHGPPDHPAAGSTRSSNSPVCSDAIDRQVKFFSMGMQMRLGFSIAAFLEPDVLLVDEVLAVGDANFQQKCLKRIGEIVRTGTTLLYVSHDLASVEASCERAVWLADAVVQASGPTKDVVTKYRAAVEQNAALVTSNEGVVQVLKAEIEAADGGQLRSECDVDVC